MKPQVEIEVDEATGVWTTDGLPMLYLPRHFIVNYHNAMVAALGREKYDLAVYDAGYKSAFDWCVQAATRGYRGIGVFEHYLQRLSQRGWGQFSLESGSIESGHASVILRNSLFVLGDDRASGKVCHMFEGWFAGAMDWVCCDAGAPAESVSREVQCAREGHPNCRFEIRPRGEA